MELPKRLVHFAFVCGIVCTFCTTEATSDDDMRTVALSSTLAANFPGEFLNFPTAPVLNSHGEVAFRATVQGPGLNEEFNSGIWSEGGGLGLNLVAFEGGRVPNTNPLSNITFADFGQTIDGINYGPPVLNNAGDIAFRVEIRGLGVTRSNNESIWRKISDSGLELIARTGDLNPDASARFFLLHDPVLNEAGQLAFESFDRTDLMVGPSVGSIWSDGGGTGLELIARSGDRPPGADADFRAFSAPQINSSGQIQFNVSLDFRQTVVHTSGVWRTGEGGDLELVALEGNGAPGTSAVFRNVAVPAFNNLGQAAFSGSLTDAELFEDSTIGLWSEGRGAGLELIARSGDNAPGTEADFAAFLRPTLNGIGNLAFLGRLSGEGVTSENEYGFWREHSDGSLKLVARTGSNAPGTEDEFGNFTAFTTPSLNNAGQMAFWGILKGTHGIWAEDRAGSLKLIARTGNQIDVDDGPGVDMRTISGLFMHRSTGSEDGNPRSFNDRGQLVFRASFTDGTSGVFVSNLVAVPEPSACVMLTIFLMSAHMPRLCLRHSGRIYR